MNPIETLRTPCGIEFALLRDHPPAPAPTLINLAVNMRDTLTCSPYNSCALRLMQEGWVGVALDIPGHGSDVRPGEQKDSLHNWSSRIARNENCVRDFTTRVSRVLDFLVEKKFTHVDRIAISGTSRGGFLALHAAAAEPRISVAAVLAPVTNLSSLKEFESMAGNPLMTSLAVVHLARSLASKKIWMAINTIDERVSTEEAWRAVQAIARENLEKGGSIEMHLMPRDPNDPNGHRIAMQEYERAAEWISSQFMKLDEQS